MKTRSQQRKPNTRKTAALLLCIPLLYSGAAYAGGFANAEPFQYANGLQGAPTSLFADENLPAVSRVRSMTLPLPRIPFLPALPSGWANHTAGTHASFWALDPDGYQRLSAVEGEEPSTAEQVVLTVVGVAAYVAIQGTNIWAQKKLDKVFAY